MVNGRHTFMSIVLWMALAIMTGCGTDETTWTHFEITSYSLSYSDKACWETNEALGYTTDEIVAVCGEDLLDETTDLQFDEVYHSLTLQTRNDSKDTASVRVLATRDDGVVLFDFESPVTTPNSASVYDIGVDLTLEVTTDDKDHMITIDSWLVNSVGIISPVYTFDLHVTRV